jgi:hypothetical protein
VPNFANSLQKGTIRDVNPWWGKPYQYGAEKASMTDPTSLAVGYARFLPIQAAKPAYTHLARTLTGNHI